MKRFGWILLALVIFLWPAVKPAQAQTAEGALQFEEHCEKCHGNPESGAATPAVLSLWKLNPEQVMAGLAKAPHTTMTGITEDNKKVIALYLGGRRVGVDAIAEAKAMPNHCSTNPAITDITSKPMWNGWGNGESNARFQSAKAAGITPDQVPNLKLKWAFGFPSADEVYGQPTVAAGRVFVATDTGSVYSLNADTGCIYWSFQADGGVRNAISIGPVKGHGATKFGVYFGDVRSYAYMLDATTGKQIWKVKVEDHPVSRVTGAPTLYEGRLYVPVSSGEERTAGYSKVYPCCTFRGSVVALDANTGKQIWKTYTVPEAPKLLGKTSTGIEQWGPNGGAVWNTPTIDAKNQAIYIGTGDAYSPPAGKTTDAIMALDLKTGKIMWAIQDTENDFWLSGCPGSGSPNCPKDMGPDYDFGASPILKSLPDGHRMLVAGQKSGMVWGHDPDREGTVAWKTPLVPKLALGIIRFGGAADDQNAYFGVSTGGLAAVRIDTGEKKWFTPIPGPSKPGPRGETSAVTVMPGVVFSGSSEGILRAFSTDDGRLLWDFNMVRDYQTVNGVPAKGGSMGQPGPTVAGGLLFAGSGYVFGAGTPGNALLVFSPQ
ncbi:MAG: PQQ-binding-like beta-propeller repeat protein [Acidobacteriia bacterium]|nr:PQQ-binding-like beta-propeller repeat protein [Terriglobia bacterium]